MPGIDPLQKVAPLDWSEQSSRPLYQCIRSCKNSTGDIIRCVVRPEVKVIQEAAALQARLSACDDEAERERDAVDGPPNPVWSRVERGSQKLSFWREVAEEPRSHSE
jgi:hypothetical protein